MGLKVDIGAMLAALRGVSTGLRGLASGDAAGSVADAMAARGAALIDEGFAAQTAPDGSAWAPPARAYGHPLLDATGEMRSSARCEVVTSDATRIALLFSIDDEKATWHQFGTFRGGPTTSPVRAQNRKSFRGSGAREGQHIPARKMIFSEGERPEPWVSALETVGQQALDRWMTEHVKF